MAAQGGRVLVTDGGAGVDLADAARKSSLAVQQYAAKCGRGWQSYREKTRTLNDVNTREANLRRAFARTGDDVGVGVGVGVGVDPDAPSGLLDVYDAAAAHGQALLRFAPPFRSEASITRMFRLADRGAATSSAAGSATRDGFADAGADRDPAAQASSSLRPAVLGPRRKPAGSAAIAPTLDAFRRNLAIFTENALSRVGWDGVVVAGGCVLACLQAAATNRSARSIRKRFHRGASSKADVDLFLVGFGKGPAEEVCCRRWRRETNGVCGGVGLCSVAVNSMPR